MSITDLGNPRIPEVWMQIYNIKGPCACFPLIEIGNPHNSKVNELATNVDKIFQSVLLMKHCQEKCDEWDIAATG